MNNGQGKQRYDRPPPPPDIQAKLELCEREAAGLSVREVRCPKCHFVIDRVFSDVSGHFISKCPKCKSQYIMNFVYFRKQKGSWRLKRKYYGENYFKKLNNK